MLACGVDPGFGQRNATGWVVAEVLSADPERVLRRGVLPATGQGDDARLMSLAAGLLKEFRPGNGNPVPDVFAVELPFRGPNQRTVAALCRIAGIVTALAALNHRPCVTVQPAEAKLALTGKGNATKRDMIAAAWLRFGLRGRLTEAEADAAGIALAGALRWREAQWRNGNAV